MEDCSDDVRRVFNICDEDGDGVITTAQLKGILCELGIENVDSIIDEFTSLGEGGEHGSVTYPQFLQVWIAWLLIVSRLFLLTSIRG